MLHKYTVRSKEVSRASIPQKSRISQCVVASDKLPGNYFIAQRMRFRLFPSLIKDYYRSSNNSYQCSRNRERNCLFIRKKINYHISSN